MSADGEWWVRPAGPAVKEYRCPGCDQVIAIGVKNLVAWRADSIWGDTAAVADRRHWHTWCWHTRHGAGKAGLG